MIPPKIKGKILTLHRLVGLVAAPVLLLLAISGGALAFRPILGAGAAPGAPVDVAALRAALDAVDPGGAATRVRVMPDGQRAFVETSTRTATSSVTVELATRARVADAPEGADPFEPFRKLHRELLVGAGVVVTAVTFALLALAVLGPLIAWPRRRNTLAGWHTGVGWFLLPLVAIAPVTGAMMTLHLGEPARPKGNGRGPGISITLALDAAAKEGLDLRALILATRSGRGVALATGGPGAARYLVSPEGTVGPVPPEPWTKQLHEGTWGAPVSGLVSLTAALATLILLSTGTLAWARRKLRRSAGKAEKAAAKAGAA